MRKLDYEGLSDGELAQVLERSVAKYEAGPDTRRAAERARVLSRLLPTRRFFATRAEASATYAAESLLTALLLPAAITGIARATLDCSLGVAAGIWLVTLGGVVAAKYRASLAARRDAGVRSSL